MEVWKMAEAKAHTNARREKRDFADRASEIGNNKLSGALFTSCGGLFDQAG